MLKLGFHPFHMLSLSPWPILCSFSVMNSMISLYSLMNGFCSTYNFLLIFLSLNLIVYQWWRDVIRESTYQGCHSMKVMSGIYLGFLMFICSEVMFFFSFFFGYFFLSLNPDSYALGSCWPPTGLSPINYESVPLLNTLILLSSGVSITWSHHSLIESNYNQCKIGLMLTIFLGFIFSIIQAFEYYECSFCMSDSAYGSLFFIATGFHGIHVLVGSIFLFIVLIRLMKFHLSKNHHISFEVSAWYWHFVDVVWLFLFLSIYWWGS
uniref:cytochrome c oxidase subunit III n=1 Tax=Anatoecus icterodes TaxID=1195957 RepID=UPI00211E5A11|nr:cytochrome c oxidase subunit III [Anatoecus icterodes]YP_010605971.1 cytochrome c oxidase subunit III [Anatoecus dentatus]UTT72539.1 cytochrome c oxidase subunit 3 [Anatoecus icterodes]WAN81292.1 cytochrome c oxidase subunit III [Anatoecus dentatus]